MARFGHYAYAFGEQCFIFAGLTADFIKTKEKLSSHIEVFDQYLEKWKPLKTSGTPPKGLYDGACCVSAGGDLFVYGGRDEPASCCGGLYKLSSLKWSQPTPCSITHGPLRKVGCRMICFNMKNVAVLGGYGLMLGQQQPGLSFINDKKSADGCGWTNEIHICNIDKCK